MVLFDLLDSFVDTEAMALMHHIIADGELREAADLLSLVIVLFPLLLPFFYAEHVTLGDNDELDQRVLKALVKLSVGDHDLPRSHRAARVLRAEGAEIIFSQITRKAARPGSRRGEENDAVAVFFPLCEVLDQDLKAVLVRV